MNGRLYLPASVMAAVTGFAAATTHRWSALLATRHDIACAPATGLHHTGLFLPIAGVLFALALIIPLRLDARRFLPGLYAFTAVLVTASLIWSAAARLLPALLPIDSLIWGDAYARMAADYAHHFPWASAAQSAGLGAILFLLHLPARRLLSPSNSPLPAVRLLVSGAATGAALALMHTSGAATAMISGHSRAALAITLLVTANALAFSLIMVSNSRHTSPRTATSIPTAAIPGVLAALCASAFYGHTAYLNTTAFHSDITYAYIRFISPNSHERTIDQSANSSRAWALERFLAMYPYSAYRPAALASLAGEQYNLWAFDEARETLRLHQTQYPDLSGARDILRELAALAAGSDASILRPAPRNSALAQWRRTQGAYQVYLSARLTGRPILARAALSAYIDYLNFLPPRHWVGAEIARASGLFDSIPPEKRLQPVSRGTVTLTVTDAGQPVRTARLILVQPRPDPTLPGDSRQFTGAWTLPAWRARWANADRNGTITVRNVPYGHYQIVLGLELKSTRRDRVISRHLAPITVRSAVTQLGELALVPRVSLTHPSPGAPFAAGGELRWEAYPGAAYYTVSVMDQGKGPVDPLSPRTASTCWTRTHIRSTHATLDRRSTASDESGLQPGRSYMWLVIAHSSSGAVISTSEHYFDLREPGFVLTNGFTSGREHSQGGNHR